MQISSKLVSFFIALVIAHSTAIANSFFEVNSESVFYPSIKTTQADLKLLLGTKIYWQQDHWVSLAIGGYGLYQNVDSENSFQRLGPLTQLKLNLFKNNLFFQYEHHYYNPQSSPGVKNTNYYSENRYGLIAAFYEQLAEAIILDFYAESFYIPEITKESMLTTARATFMYSDETLNALKLAPFAETYFRDAPSYFGGDREEVRLGLKYQPWSFISFKIYSSVLSPSDKSLSGIQGQINIYCQGSLL